MEKRLKKSLLDTLEKDAAYIESIRVVFTQAYRDGRADGANGLFIDSDLALQIFLEREGNRSSLSIHTYRCWYCNWQVTADNSPDVTAIGSTAEEAACRCEAV
jgi:hypothetical protein